MSIAKYESLLQPGQKLTEEQYETDRNLVALERQVSSTLNRRNFLGTLLAAAAVAGTVGSRSAEAQTSTPTVIDVLNFALNLEYLEANLYLSATGQTLSSTDMGTSPGMVTGAPGKITLDSITNSLFLALAADEVHHIETIRSTISNLGGTPISMPNINLAFMGTISTQAQLLATARQFTAVGGSAYAGSAQLLVSNTAVLTAAAQILGAEGQHDGAVNYQLVNQGYGIAQSPMVDAYDVVPNTSQYFSVFSPTSSAANMPMALFAARTPQQVLGIVYGKSTSATTTPTAGTTSGGFFPSGFNGNVKST